MPDSDIPAIIEDDEDEATMMWNREEFDPEGDLLTSGELDSALRKPGAESEPGPRDAAGLDAADLFGDVLEDGGADPKAALASESLVDEKGTPAISAAPLAPDNAVAPVQVQMPKTTSLVAPAPRSRAGLWVALAGVTALGAAAGAYVMRARLGPVGEWIESLGLQELLGLPL